MDKREIAKKQEIAEILNELLFGKIRRIRNTVCRITLTLAIMQALDALGK